MQAVKPKHTNRKIALNVQEKTRKKNQLKVPAMEQFTRRVVNTQDKDENAASAANRTIWQEFVEPGYQMTYTVSSKEAMMKNSA